jgi:branched-chain amino acid transport system ATP-binding protein
LLVEQNFKMASELADHYFILDDGQTVNAGRMADLVKDSALINKYLGVA